MCGQKYREESTNKSFLSLCLFCDGTLLVKSKNLSLWVMFASILELPQKVRESKNNMLVLSFLVGTLENFNEWVRRVADSYKNLFDGNTKIDNYTARLFCGIFDLPARAKAMNMISHNGYFACIHCLAPGEYENNTIYPITVCEFRDDKCIKKAIKAAFKLNESSRTKNKTVLGLKRKSALSKYINIRTDVVYDYMHLCCE